jgi:HlyD family secretion protein
LSDTQVHVTELEQKVEGERIASAADVASAIQKRDKASFDVRETERIIASLTIKAPAPGSVSVLPNSRAGGMGRAAPEFRPGDRAWFGAPIVELPDLSSVQMTCRIDEADRARIQAGSVATVRVDAVPDRELKGTIRDIAVMAKPDFSIWPPVRNFDVVVGLADADARLRSGMSASARIELDRLPGVLLVPTAAVFQRAGATIVYVVSAGDVAEPRSVTVLRRGRDQTAIATGIREGERLALKEPDASGAIR